MYYKIIRIVYFFFTLPILYLFIIEFFIRSLIFIISLNSSVFLYGIDKNISINLHSITSGELYITNTNFKKNQLDLLNNNKKNEIWIFGGSTSNKGFCDSKDISWVDLLDSNLKKKNFSKNGINSSFSLNILKHELKSKESPEIIIWANKVNEILHAKRNYNLNDRTIYNLNSIKKTLKNNSITFYFFDEFLIRIFDKFGINLRYEKKLLKNSDLIISSNEYFKNTKEAIILSDLSGVENFYIVSLFNKSNLQGNENEFYKHYREKVEELTKKFNKIKFIDTKKDLNIRDKKLDLFCDSMHQNYYGKIVTAKIISKYLNEN